MNQILQSIMSRRSIRKFKPVQITEEELIIILNAGKAAPSSLNKQPWHFTVIQNKELIDRIVNENKAVVLADEGLKQRAPWVNAPNYHNFYNAPTVILISGDAANMWHVCDCALAMENMSLAAWAMSIGTCIIASTRFVFSTEKSNELLDKLNIPQGYSPLFALSVGYIDGDLPNQTQRNQDCVNFIR